MVGDRVLVEASYNSSMPFKWNATRIQVLPMGNNSNPNVNAQPTNQSNRQQQSNRPSGAYNAVPPPTDNTNNRFLNVFFFFTLLSIFLQSSLHFYCVVIILIFCFKRASFFSHLKSYIYSAELYHFTHRQFNNNK